MFSSVDRASMANRVARVARNSSRKHITPMENLSSHTVDYYYYYYYYITALVET